MTHPFLYKPDPGPSLDELLEGFWDGKEQRFTEPTNKVVWVLEHIYLEEKGDDAFFYQVFESKEAALWSYWYEQVEEVYNWEPQDWGDLTPTAWMAESLTALQNLRDDELHQNFDIVYRLRELEVL